MKLIAMILIALLLSAPIFAQDLATPPQDNAPILKKQPAPFSGILVPESRFTEYLDLELQIEELEARLRIQENLVLEVEKVYTTKLEAATRPEKWYATSEFNRLLGFIVGVGVTVAVFFAGAELTKALR